MAKSTKLTYKLFAELAILLAQAVVNGTEFEVDGFDYDLFIEKAESLIAREDKKSEYSRANKKPTESKVSDTTKANAKAILSVLSAEPITTAEINKALGAEFEPLTVSNAIRYIEREIGIVKSKKVEEVIRIKDGVKCKDQSPKTAYALAPTDTE